MILLLFSDAYSSVSKTEMEGKKYIWVYYSLTHHKDILSWSY